MPAEAQRASVCSVARTRAWRSPSGGAIGELSDDWESGLRRACEALEELARHTDPAEDEELRLRDKTVGRSPKLSLCMFQSSVVSESAGSASAMVVQLVRWAKFSERNGAAIRFDVVHVRRGGEHQAEAGAALRISLGCESVLRSSSEIEKHRRESARGCRAAAG